MESVQRRVLVEVAAGTIRAVRINRLYKHTGRRDRVSASYLLTGISMYYTVIASQKNKKKYASSGSQQNANVPHFKIRVFYCCFSFNSRRRRAIRF